MLVGADGRRRNALCRGRLDRRSSLFTLFERSGWFNADTRIPAKFFSSNNGRMSRLGPSLDVQRSRVRADACLRLILEVDLLVRGIDAHAVRHSLLGLERAQSWQRASGVVRARSLLKLSVHYPFSLQLESLDSFKVVEVALHLA